MVSFTDIMKLIWAFSSVSLQLGIFPRRQEFLFLSNKIGFHSCEECRNVDPVPRSEIQKSLFFRIKIFY